VTGAFIIASIAVIIAFDLWLWVSDRPTISRVIAIKAQEHRVILLLAVLAIGILVGHWFWPIVIC